MEWRVMSSCKEKDRQAVDSRFIPHLLFGGGVIGGVFFSKELVLVI